MDESREIYQYYVHEINILVGCLIRWRTLPINYHKIIAQNLILEDFSHTLIINKTIDSRSRIFQYFVESIASSPVNVTAIKASIRSLLRSSSDRREALICLVENTFIGEENAEKMIAVIKTDLSALGGELGYPIPVVDPIGKRDILEGVGKKSWLENLSYQESIRNLAIRLNRGEMTFLKSKFESDIYNILLSQCLDHGIHELKSTFMNRVKSGVHLAYANFALREAYDGYFLDNEGDVMIDLNNTFC